MTARTLQAPRLSALFATALLGFAALAQERPGREIKPMCQAVSAVVMLSKVSCTAALCNTGAAQGGLTGLLAQRLNRGAIDGASFSAGVGAQLATALKQTGCFQVLDTASLEEVRKEMEALGKPMPPVGNVDYLVRTSITKADYVFDESNFLGYKKRTATSSLTLDTKLVSPSQGTVWEAGSFDAVSERTSSGVDVPFYSSNGDAAKRGTPFSEVAQEVVVKAALGLTTKILARPAEAARPATAAALPQVVEPAASSPQ